MIGTKHGPHLKTRNWSSTFSLCIGEYLGGIKNNDLPPNGVAKGRSVEEKSF